LSDAVVDGFGTGEMEMKKAERRQRRGEQEAYKNARPSDAARLQQGRVNNFPNRARPFAAGNSMRSAAAR